MNNPMITVALLDGLSIIVVGHAPLESKVTAFQSLVGALADERKLGVIDEHHVLPTVPPSATVIDADGKGVDAIHRRSTAPSERTTSPPSRSPRCAAATVCACSGITPVRRTGRC